MTMRILITLSLTFAIALSQAAGENAEVISLLHEASKNIDKHSNYEKITESLYSQIRPRANITNKQLSEKQIDERVRKYIAKKYAPALVGNYSVIYSELQKRNKSFSSCDNIAPIEEKEKNILKALCLRKTQSVLKYTPFDEKTIHGLE